MHDSFYGVSEQSKAGKHRGDDALALLAASRWRCAMYVAGYSVECLLKTKLMQKYRCRHLRSLEDELLHQGILAPGTTVFTHRLEVLMKLTNSFDLLRSDRDHWLAFNRVNRWVTDWRYSPDLSCAKDANSFVEAVGKICRWIESNS